MRRVTVHHHIWFKDVAAETGDEAAAVVKQALTEMHEHCQTQLAEALADIGATDVKLETIVY